MNENIKDNTYMLFSDTCGISKPLSFQTLSQTKKTKISVVYNRTNYANLNYLRVSLEKLKNEYDYIYKYLKENYENDQSWRYIILCIHTMMKMIQNIIQDYALAIYKTVGTPLIDVLLFPLFSIIFLFTATIRAYLNGENLREHFYNIAVSIKETFTNNISSITSILIKYSQSLAFLFMCKKMSTPEKPTKPHKKEKAPDIGKIVEKSVKVMTETQRYVLNAKKYFGDLFQDVQLLSSSLFWGAVSYVSQKAVDILRFFFNNIKEKAGIKRCDSFIFDKFENTIDGVEVVINKKYLESAEKLQKIALKVKNQFKVAKIVLDMQNLILLFSQFISYYGCYVYIDQIYILSWIYEGAKFLNNAELYNLSIPSLLFLASLILKLIGTCWNYMQYKTCVYSKCDIIDYNVYIDLERKTCMSQCWNQGVDGISSILVPQEIIAEIKKKYGGTDIITHLLPLIDINNSIQKGGISSLLMKKMNVNETMIKFNEMLSLLSGENFYSGLI